MTRTGHERYLTAAEVARFVGEGPRARDVDPTPVELSAEGRAFTERPCRCGARDWFIEGGVVARDDDDEVTDTTLYLLCESCSSIVERALLSAGK